MIYQGLYINTFYISFKGKNSSLFIPFLCELIRVNYNKLLKTQQKHLTIKDCYNNLKVKG